MSSEYRYELSRLWGVGKRVVFVMVNPSTADEKTDDPTIRKCIGFAKRWGMNGLTVVNLWPARATNPADLIQHHNPNGAVIRNEIAIRTHITNANLVVFAWGATLDRAKKAGLEPATDPFSVARLAGKEPTCLGRTKSGQPRHPLMLAYRTDLSSCADLSS